MNIGNQKSVTLNDKLYEDLFCEADVESSDNYLTSKDNYDKMNMLDELIKGSVFTQVSVKHNSIIRLVCTESLTELEFDEDE
jgi:hypothetical protein